jgi:hypothetical protein
MKDAFNASAVTDPAELFLIGEGVEYSRLPDGRLFVAREFSIGGRGLEVLPDLTDVVFGAAFACDVNRLTSLKGAPREVRGIFICDGNLLTDLRGAPRKAGSFACQNNLLTDLKGAPPRVKGAFYCSGNKLTSLRGAPYRVSGNFYCSENPTLETLEHAPRRFQRLISDFGKYSAWKNIPDHLRFTGETRERLRKRRERLLEFLGNSATTLQRHVTVKRPLHIKANKI